MTGGNETSRKKQRPIYFLLGDTPAATLGLNLTDKTVLRCLVDHLNHKRNGTEVWPSNARIAALTGAHPETVVKSKLRLHEKEFIKIRRNSGKSDMCTIHVEKIRALVDSSENTGGLGQRRKAHPSANTGEYPQGNAEETPPEKQDLTAKEQSEKNSLPKDPSFGGSATLKVVDGDQQRQHVMLGIVAQTTDQLRSPVQKRPTTNVKRGDGADVSGSTSYMTPSARAFNQQYAQTLAQGLRMAAVVEFSGYFDTQYALHACTSYAENPDAGHT